MVYLSKMFMQIGFTTVVSDCDYCYMRMSFVIAGMKET